MAQKPASPKNWLPLIGSIEIGKNVISQLPSSGSGPRIGDESPIAVVRSDMIFDEGEVEFEALLGEPAARCQLMLSSSGGDPDVVAGLNVGQAPYGFAHFRNGQWETLGGSGHGTSLLANHWYSIRVKVLGSNLTLFVSDIEVARVSFRVQSGPLGLFFQGDKKSSVRNVRVLASQPICFVAMQFSPEFNELFSEVIRPTCENFGYRVIRADDQYSNGLIIDDITRSIREAAIVIADITPNNLNVFYEVGFSHGIGKPTILLSDRRRERLPFDISGFRTLFYDNTIGGKSAVQERLQRHLESIAAN